MIQNFVSVVLIGLSIAQAAVYRLPVAVDWKDRIEARAILYGDGFREEIPVTVLPSRSLMLIAGPRIPNSNAAIHLDNENGVDPGIFHIEDRLTFSTHYAQSILFVEEFVYHHRSLSLIHNYSNHSDTSLLLGIEWDHFVERYCLRGSTLPLTRTNRRVEFSLPEPNSSAILRFQTHLGYYGDTRRVDAVCSLPFQWYRLITVAIVSTGSIHEQTGLFANCYPSVLNQLSPITIRFLDHGNGRSAIVIQPEDYLVFDTSRDGFCYLKISPMWADESTGRRPFLNTFALRGVNTFITPGVTQICDSSIV